MSDSERIRILIVEDHFVVRAGLMAIIDSQPDMITVAEAGNGRQAVELFEQHEPDVTLMDLRIPGIDCPILSWSDSGECYWAKTFRKKAMVAGPSFEKSRGAASTLIRLS